MLPFGADAEGGLAPEVASSGFLRPWPLKPSEGRLGLAGLCLGCCVGDVVLVVVVLVGPALGSLPATSSACTEGVERRVASVSVSTALGIASPTCGELVWGLSFSGGVVMWCQSLLGAGGEPRPRPCSARATGGGGDDDSPEEATMKVEATSGACCVWVGSIGAGCWLVVLWTRGGLALDWAGL